MPRIISRIIDQYDFEGPPVSGNALVYDSSTQKFKTLPVNSNATGILSIANGGTSSSTATGALAALGAIGSITSTNGSVSLASSGTNVDLSVTIAGSTNNVVVQVKNLTGSLLTKGTVVYINAATGQLPNVTKALATSDATSAQTLGMLSADLANGGTGYVTIIGLIDDIDTSLYQDGDQLYLSGTTAGTFTKTKPYAPIHLVYVGVVQYAHQNHGKIFVKVQNGYELDELHDVVAQYPTSGQTIIYNSANELWETNYLAITNSISSVPVSSGIGNDLTLSAGSGVGVGAGGNVILNPGTQGSSGGDGKIIINSDAIINGLTIGKGNNYEIASTAVGISALETNIAGVANTAIGYNALQYNEYGSYNIAIGPQTLFSNIGGDSNIAIGLYSLYYNTEGIANLSLGNNALYNNSIGNSNIALGTDSLNNNTSGNYNISIGNYALGDHQSGNNNIGIGVSAGNLHYYGSSNIFIGDNISSPQFTISNFMSIGNLIFASGGFGTATTVGIGNVGIGNPTPTAKLHIVGTSGTTKGLIVQSVSGQTANLQEWSNSSGTALSYIDASGNLYENNILALPITSGAGNNINIIAGSGVTSGAGGSVILKAGIKATTGSDGTVIVQQASGQTRNYFEIQNSSGQLAASIEKNSNLLLINKYNTGNSSPSFLALQPAIANENNKLITGFNGGNGGLDIYGGALNGGSGLSTSSIVPLYASFNANGQVGIGTSTTAARLHVAGLYNGNFSDTKLMIIRPGGTGQTNTLQEWQNSAGTALASVNANGTFTIGTTGTNQRLIVQGGTNAQATEAAFVVKNAAGSNVLFVDAKRPEVAIGSALYFGQGNATSSYFTIDSQSGFSWVSNVTTAPDIDYVFAVGTSANITKSTGTTNNIAGLAVGPKFYPTTGTISYSSIKCASTINQTSAASGTVRGLWVNDTITSVLGEYRAIETARGNVVINAGIASSKGISIIGASGQTANLQEWSNSSGTALSYINASGNLYNNNLLALPTSSGAGNNINIIAGSGVSSGAGGSIILKAGVQAASGGDGSIIVRQSSGQAETTLFRVQSSASTDLYRFDYSSAGNKVFSIGTATTLGSNGTLQVGLGTVGGTQTSTVIGHTASSAGANGTAIGFNANNSGGGFAGGMNATAGAGGVAIGYGSSSGQGVAIGNASSNNAAQGVAIGINSSASQLGVAIGGDSSLAYDSIGIGSVSNTSTNTGYGSIALGHYAKATGRNQFVIKASPRGNYGYVSYQDIVWQLPITDTATETYLTSKARHEWSDFNVATRTGRSVFSTFYTTTEQEGFRIQSYSDQARVSFGGVASSGTRMIGYAGLSSEKVLVLQGASGQTANLQEWQNSSGTPLSYLDASGNFYAISKSFLIPHPSPEKAAVGRKLRYASLEGPEHAVFFRGNLCNSNQIDLPNYWKDLVHADSITVSLTAKKYAQPNLFVKESNNIKIIIDSDRPINCDYIVYGTRKDVEKLEVETDVC